MPASEPVKATMLDSIDGRGPAKAHLPSRRSSASPTCPAAPPAALRPFGRRHRPAHPPATERRPRIPSSHRSGPASTRTGISGLAPVAQARPHLVRPEKSLAARPPGTMLTPCMLFQPRPRGLGLQKRPCSNVPGDNTDTCGPGAARCVSARRGGGGEARYAFRLAPEPPSRGFTPYAKMALWPMFAMYLTASGRRAPCRWNAHRAADRQNPSRNLSFDRWMAIGDQCWRVRPCRGVERFPIRREREPRMGAHGRLSGGTTRRFGGKPGRCSARECTIREVVEGAEDEMEGWHRAGSELG